MPQTRKIVVIGSNSFAGQDFIDLALDDPAYEIIGTSRSPEFRRMFLRYRDRGDLSRYRFEQIDFNRDMDALLALLDRERPDYVVNFSALSEVAVSWEHPEHYLETNTVALAKLVNHLRHQDYLERFLQISSPEAFGNCVGTVTEDTPDNPSTPYAASKAAADMLLDAYHRQYGFPMLIVRSTNYYGARQQLFKIIPRSVIRILMNEPIELHGGGKAVKSFIHIRDVSKGELAILERGEIGRRYNLSPPEGIAIKDVVGMICGVMGVSFDDATRTVDERPGQDAAYVIDSSRLRSELGWKPRISMSDGIQELIDWVKANWEEIQALPLTYEHKA